MNEFQIIAALRGIFDSACGPLAADTFPVPNGDDAGVVRTSSGMATLTTDALVEGVHFAFDLCSYADAGFRAVAVNLSDLAAMAARPTGILVSLMIPDGMSDDVVLDVGRGIAECCARYGSPVLGGNVTRIDGPFVISITAVGDQTTFPPPLRSGAGPGDEIWFSGFAGEGALGLRVIREMPAEVHAFPGLVSAWRRPAPRLDLAGLMARAGVTAAIDVSDGLVADVGHIADESGVRAEIDPALLPISAEAMLLSGRPGFDGFMESLLYGGDDYQLVLTARPDSSLLMRGAGLTVIGRMVEGSGVGVAGIDQSGSAAGWQHRR